jgi:UDP-2,3-diacylglucosamine hydrolase
MTTLFASDLHLDASRPHITARFLQFLGEECQGADALYLLGDLFEYWVGDDDPQPLAGEVADALHALASSGVPIHFLRGNRDFLLGDGYAARAGLRILPDPCVILLYGHPTLLMHGDLLCTGDLQYQAFRRQTRDPDWQREMLAQPLPIRMALALRARAASAEHQQLLRDAHGNAAATGDTSREDITDVSTDAVESLFARYGIDRLIHGHTHRPAIHSLPVSGIPRTRIVLGDWYEQGSVLRVDADGMALASL